MNSCWYYSWIYPMIGWNSYHMHHIEIILGKRSIFDQKSKFPWHWTSRIGDFNWKGHGEDHETRKCNKIWKNWLLTMTVDRWPGGWPVEEPVDQFVGAGNLKSPLVLHFSHFLLHSLPPLHIPASRGHFRLDFGLIEGLDLFLGRIWARALIWNPGFQLLGASSLCTARLKVC